MQEVKGLSTDTDEGAFIIRDITSVDTAVSVWPKNTPSYAVLRNRRRQCELRFYSDTAGGTITFAVKLWPRGANRNTVAPFGFQYNSAGIVAYSGVWTCSGQTYPLIHPVTGAVSTATFNEASADTTNTFIAGSQVYMFPQQGISAATFSKRMIVDAHGYAALSVEITAMSGGRSICSGHWTD